MPTSNARIRPVEKLAAALAKCATESAIYGRCVVADFNSVSKDKCLTEFMRLKDCYVVRHLTYLHELQLIEAESSEAEIVEFFEPRFRFFFFFLSIGNYSKPIRLEIGNWQSYLVTASSV